MSEAPSELPPYLYAHVHLASVNHRARAGTVGPGGGAQAEVALSMQAAKPTAAGGFLQR